MEKIEKYYAAYRAGYLGENVLDTYFSFMANIINEENMSIVEDVKIREAMKKRYDIELPLSFIRQVLAIGVKNKCFVQNRGKYSVSVTEIEKYKFVQTEFETLWGNLIVEFDSYCRETNMECSSIKLEEFILNMLDETDEIIISTDVTDSSCATTSLEYSWYDFVKKQSEKKSDLFSYIAAISASNITTQALFYNGETKPNYSNLHVYLDSPIIFSLLGMDEEVKVNSYRTLVNDMVKAKCQVHVFDHSFQEVDGIIARAATWANSTDYDLRKANNAARFFHDSRMNTEKISEFCEGLENQLNELGVTIEETAYDCIQHKYQEDEEEIFNMIEKNYENQGVSLQEEKINSIQKDVRSIIFVYRRRKGQTATKLENSKHIMLTSNNAIANVSKKYESNRSINAGNIPACISADLFGAILWLNTPLKMQEYNKQRLLGDCYAFLKPSKKMLDKYMASLDEARRMDKIDEKKFLFLRAHSVVLDSLMDITKGDYARFDNNTYLEVYDHIQAKANKQYNDEANAHKRTRLELEKEKKRSNMEKETQDRKIESLELEIRLRDEKEKKRLEKHTVVLGYLLTLFIATIPYIILITTIEIVKNKYTDMSFKSIEIIILCIIATLIAAKLFTKAKEICFRWAKKLIEILYIKNVL